MRRLSLSTVELVSGVVGGVIGSVLSYVGAWWLQRSAKNRQDRMASRAVYSELTWNGATAALLMEDPNRYAPLVAMNDEAWRSHAASVAVSLSAGDFTRVSMAYEMLTYTRFLIERWRESEATPSEREAIVKVARAFSAAADAMVLRVWSDQDRANMHAAHEAMQERVKVPLEDEGRTR